MSGAFSVEDMEVLGHVLQEGAVLSSHRMSEFVDARWKVSVSGLRAVRLELVPELFLQDAMAHTGASLFVREPLPLNVVVFFPDWTLAPLVAALGRAVPQLQDRTEPERLVASEAANILGHGIMKALADRCGRAFISGAPVLAHGTKTEILAGFMRRMPAAADALLTQAEFYSDRQAAAVTVLLLADAAALRGLLADSRSDA